MRKSSSSVLTPFFWALILNCWNATAAQSTPIAAETQHFRGTATDHDGEIIQVMLELKEAAGSVTGQISLGPGDFPIVAGKHEGDDLTLQFDTDGSTGTITAKLTGAHLVGTFSAGEAGGPVDLSRVVPSAALAPTPPTLS